MAQLNTLPRIDSVHAALSVDDDGSEGVCAIMSNGQWLPLIAADEARLAFIRQAAEAIARAEGRRVRVVKFTGRVEVETFDCRS